MGRNKSVIGRLIAEMRLSRSIAGKPQEREIRK
jgi:hypothetical protein